MSKEFGDRLRGIRQKNELTQKQVADTLHLDRSTYAYYERGTTEPSMGTTRKLAELFKVSVDELINGKEKQAYLKVSDVSEDLSVQKDIDEEAVLKWYRSLGPEQREQFKGFVRQMKESK